MISEPDPQKVERAMLVYRAFNFAVKAVSVAFGGDLSDGQYQAIWRVVQEVANSETTLNPSPAELMAMTGGMTEAMRTAHEQHISRMTRQEREIAAMILAASQGFHIPPQKVD